MRKLIIAGCLWLITMGSGIAQEIASEPVSTPGIENFHQQLAGDWTGDYNLWTRPDQPPAESKIVAHIRPVAGHHLMTYTWSLRDHTIEGVFLLSGHDSRAFATWGDSFHMKPEPMICVGEFLTDENTVLLNGSYTVSQGPDWGWQTVFALQDSGTLLMEAYNVTPEGERMIAVRAVMERQKK